MAGPVSFFWLHGCCVFDMRTVRCHKPNNSPEAVNQRQLSRNNTYQRGYTLLIKADKQVGLLSCWKLGMRRRRGWGGLLLLMHHVSSQRPLFIIVMPGRGTSCWYPAFYVGHGYFKARFVSAKQDNDVLRVL